MDFLNSTNIGPYSLLTAALATGHPWIHIAMGGVIIKLLFPELIITIGTERMYLRYKSLFAIKRSTKQ